MGIEPTVAAGAPPTPRAIVLAWVAGHAGELGVEAGDVADLAVVREHASRHNGLTHFALRQRVNGLEVDGPELRLAVDRGGRIVHPTGELLAGLAERAARTARSPLLGPDEAVVAAAAALGLPEVDGLDLVEADRAAIDQRAVFVNPAVSEERIETRLRYLRTEDGNLRLTWNLALKAPGASDWWNVWIDAEEGALLRRDNWTNDADTYRVFASPKESPNDGARTDEVDPWQAGGTTLPDGASPFGWHDTDSDLDNGVIAHEYGHGLSNRLTGSGPGCLANDEQMGEGWRDWVTLFLHAAPSDTATTQRSVGGYVSFEPADTPGYIGIRRFPYTTDNLVNPDTYATIATFPPDPTGTPAPEHNIGSVWAVMLWEMYWELVALDGYDPDLYFGTGGNNYAFQLVVDGLKLLPCSPGFVDGRDAILAADVADYEGDHLCAIWRAFAGRGLGAGTSQGSSASWTDGTQDFGLPAVCSGHIFSSSFGHGDTAHWSATVP